MFFVNVRTKFGQKETFMIKVVKKGCMSKRFYEYWNFLHLEPFPVSQICLTSENKFAKKTGPLELNSAPLMTKLGYKACFAAGCASNTHQFHAFEFSRNTQSWQCCQLCIIS